MGSLLEIRGLRKSYARGQRALTALEGLSFSLESGEVLGVVGGSGSGKTTLLRLITGLEAPDSGEMLLEGRLLSKRRTREERRAMQMVFQDPGSSFDPRMTIAASIAETLRNLGCGGESVSGLIASVGLDPALGDRHPGGLSGGQCQRMAIARAIAVSPRLLLCDEVTSALDVSAQAQIIALISRLARERGMSVIFVSHDLAVVSCICSRCLVLRGGRLVEEGETRRLIDSPEEEYTKKLLASVLGV